MQTKTYEKASLSTIHAALVALSADAKWAEMKAHFAKCNIGVSLIDLSKLVHNQHRAGQWSDVSTRLAMRLKACGMYDANPALAAEEEAAADGYIPRRTFVELTGASERTAPDYAARNNIRTKIFFGRVFYHLDDTQKHGFGHFSPDVLATAREVLVGSSLTATRQEILAALAGRGICISHGDAVRLVDRMHRAGQWDDIPVQIYNTLREGAPVAHVRRHRTTPAATAPTAAADCNVPLEEAMKLLGRGRSRVLALAREHKLPSAMRDQKYYFSRQSVLALAEKLGPNIRQPENRAAPIRTTRAPATESVAAVPTRTQPARKTATVPTQTPAPTPTPAPTAAPTVTPAATVAPVPSPVGTAPAFEDLFRLGMRSVDAGLLTRDELLDKLAARVGTR